MIVELYEISMSSMLSQFQAFSERVNKFCAIFLNFVVGFFQGLKFFSYFIKGCGMKNVSVLEQNWPALFFFFNIYFKGVLTYFEGPNNL